MRDLKDIVNQYFVDKRNIQEIEGNPEISYGMPEDKTDYKAEYEAAKADYNRAVIQHEQAAAAWNTIPPDIMKKAQDMQREWTLKNPGSQRMVSEFFGAAVDERVNEGDMGSDEARADRSISWRLEDEKFRYRKIEEDYFSTAAKMNECKQKMVSALRNLESEHGDMQFRSKEMIVDDFKKYSFWPFIVGVLWAALIIHMIILTISMVNGITKLQTSYFNKNPFYLFFWIIYPIALWIWSTSFDFWDYWKRKSATLYLGIVSILLLMMSQLARMFYGLIVPLIFKFKPTDMFTESDIARTAIILILVLSLLPTILIFVAVQKFISRRMSVEWIKNFKVLKGRDTRKDTEFKYDMRAVRNLKTGERILIKEKDRFLHGFADGATGTGKTSSVFNTMIENDLSQIAYNVDWQKKQVVKLLEEGKVRLKKNFTDAEFSMDNIEPVYTDDVEENEKRKKTLEDIEKKAPEAGVVVIAPNEGLADDVYKLAKGRNLKINRIDPMRGDHGEPKEGCIGFNPLYISPLIEGLARYDDIVNKATVVCDVLNNLNQMSGKVDAYFVGVNSIQTVTTCKLLMLTYPSLTNGKQPTLRDVQRLLNNYEEMRKYLYELIHLYGNHGEPMALPENFDQNNSYSEEKRELWFKNNNIDCGLWQDVFTVVKNELLDRETGKVQFERANGLRNQLNLFLNTPRVADVMCREDTIDIDKFLADGGVTIFNYSMALGTSTSMAFGQFFLLSYDKAVLRRPRHKFCRPIFMFCDEFPQIVSQATETLFTLHRQFNCANFIALQNLNQMNKSDVTRYLKDILIGNCATKIVFGRLGPEEQKLFEQLGGTELEYLEQETISEKAMTNPDPGLSFSTRSTLQTSPIISGNDMAYRDFRECTVFTVDDGNLMKPFPGKVEFLKDSEWVGNRRILVNWSRWYRDFPEYTAWLPNTGSRFIRAGFVGEDEGPDADNNPRLTAFGEIIYSQHTSQQIQGTGQKPEQQKNEQKKTPSPEMTFTSVVDAFEALGFGKDE